MEMVAVRTSTVVPAKFDVLASKFVSRLKSDVLPTLGLPSSAIQGGDSTCSTVDASAVGFMAIGNRPYTARSSVVSLGCTMMCRAISRATATRHPAAATITSLPVFCSPIDCPTNRPRLLSRRDSASGRSKPTICADVPRKSLSGNATWSGVARGLFWLGGSPLVGAEVSEAGLDVVWLTMNPNLLGEEHLGVCGLLRSNLNKYSLAE